MNSSSEEYISYSIDGYVGGKEKGIVAYVSKDTCTKVGFQEITGLVFLERSPQCNEKLNLA